jgi:hypothetical protein
MCGTYENVLKEMAFESVDWIYQAQGRDQWRVIVNTITNVR